MITKNFYDDNCEDLQKQIEKFREENNFKIYTGEIRYSKTSVVHKYRAKVEFIKEDD